MSTILKNGRSRLAFQFGRVSAFRSANDVIDQLQAQLDAERKQHAFDVAESEKQIAILIRDLMQAKYELAQRNVVETFAKWRVHQQDCIRACTHKRRS